MTEIRRAQGSRFIGAILAIGLSGAQFVVVDALAVLALEEALTAVSIGAQIFQDARAVDGLLVGSIGAVLYSVALQLGPNAASVGASEGRVQTTGDEEE